MHLTGRPAGVEGSKCKVCVAAPGLGRIVSAWTKGSCMNQCTVSDFIVGQFSWATTGFIGVPVWTSDWARNCDLVFFLLNESTSLTRLHPGGRLSDNLLTFVLYLVSFSKKEPKETMAQQLLIFCRCWWSYASVGVHIVTAVICCRWSHVVSLLCVLHQRVGAFSVTAQPYITTIKMYCLDMERPIIYFNILILEKVL